MKVNSFELSILTPVKDSVGQKDSASKVHQFLHHEEVSFSDLEGLKLTIKCISDIENFRTGVDVPTILVEKEKIAIKKKTFTNQMKKYLAEEFNIPQEKAFSVIYILSYGAKTGQELQECVEELFGRNSCEDVCSDCLSSKDLEEDDDDELYASDDSYNDKDYELSHSLSSENSSEDSRDSSELVLGNDAVSLLSPPSKDIYEFEEEDNFKVYNPFWKLRQPDQTSGMVNSTFAPMSDGSRPKFSHELSPIDKSKLSSNPSTCPHCSKTFSKNNNLKRHLISVHKVFPKGVAVYECPVEGCLFTSDNQAHFSRHKHRKSNSVLKEKCKCDICGSNFFNNSSLSRHMKRKHSQV